MTDLPMTPEPPENPPMAGIVVIGRFQPLHFGHAILLRAAAEQRAAHAADSTLIIGIGSANRPSTLANPWTAEERESMVTAWLDAEGIENTHICSIPDIEDPPNWVRHAERYHGEAGCIFTTDFDTAELYTAAGWDVVLLPLEQRENYEGWRVRETARMLSTVHDEEAVRSVLGSLVPSSVLDLLINTNSLARLAYMGEGGEPVG